jgi:hypothetical protein
MVLDVVLHSSWNPWNRAPTIHFVDRAIMAEGWSHQGGKNGREAQESQHYGSLSFAPKPEAEPSHSPAAQQGLSVMHPGVSYRVSTATGHGYHLQTHAVCPLVHSVPQAQKNLESTRPYLAMVRSQAPWSFPPKPDARDWKRSFCWTGSQNPVSTPLLFSDTSWGELLA